MEIVYCIMALALAVAICWYCRYGGACGDGSTQELNRTILMKTKEALDAIGLRFFLGSGTCLGYARERNFIEHSEDIDIGIYAKDYTPTMIDELGKRGLYLYRAVGGVGGGMALSFYLPTGTHHRAQINVHLYTEVGPKTCWCSYNAEHNTKLQYCVSRFDLKEVDFLGIRINVPDPVGKYLEEHYGKAWRIPKR